MKEPQGSFIFYRYDFHSNKFIMKLHFYIYISFFYVLFSCKNTGQKPDADVKEVVSISKKAVPVYQKNSKKLNIKGNVRSIKCTNYQQFIPDSELKYFVTKQDYEFDNKGNVLEEVIYNEHEQLDYRKQYLYDDMGNCLITKSFDVNNNLAYSSSITLNEKGLFVSEEYAEQDLVRVYFHNYDTVSDSLIVYHFVEHESRKGANVKVDSIYKATQLYDKGNLIKQTNYSDGRISSIREFKYDQNDNEIFRSYLTNHLMKWEFKYDENNRQINWKVQNDYNNMTREIKRTYDNAGNVVKEVSFVNGKLSEEESFTDVYVYDKYNNWIKRSRFKLNGGKISILERKIIYF